MEQRRFLRPFVGRFAVDAPNITIEYAVRLRPNKGGHPDREGLSIAVRASGRGRPEAAGGRGRHNTEEEIHGGCRRHE